MTHSPGPWKWCAGGARLEDAVGVPVIGFDRRKGTLYLPGGGDSKLIEAAPEMLDILRDALEGLGSIFRGEDKNVEARIEAIIARVEGR